MHQISVRDSKQTATPAVDSRWIALGAVQSAMEVLGLKARDIAVLRGLLTFILPDRWADQLMVYASNKTLQTRCDGIDERTLRRRLARLCEVGLIVRQQSPNRKRYVVRDTTGNALLSYGFDLTPLRENLKQLQAIAENHRISLLRIKVLKAVLRDRLHRLQESGFRSETDAMSMSSFKTLLRQKADIATLENAIKAVENLLPAEENTGKIKHETPLLTDSDGQIDRDIQSSKKEYIDRAFDTATEPKNQRNVPNGTLTLQECIETAPSAMEFCQEPPQSWSDLSELAHQLAPAIGIQPHQLHRTKETLGEYGASLAILGLVEAFSRIKDPSRYLNALTKKAATLGLNLTRMFRSLTAKRQFPAGNPA